MSRHTHTRTCAARPTGFALGPRAAAVLLLALFSPLLSRAQQQRPSEYEVKAVYLFNFSRFVSWPAGPAADSSRPFSICVLGKDPFGAALDSTLAGESIGGRKVVARRLAQPEQALDCRVLFISASEEARLKDILAALDKSSVLTVSDLPHFNELGGMIQFVLQGDRVRFAVNLDSASEARLTLSSNLLKVAVAVKGNPPRGE
ncbi:MAG TPA: YfiR family protein [Candidatus Acidoferrales bacterium]|nr:YfiR family protein [Candidatus Acidoferrales bacterium]